ncbi:hypothetical protein JZ751_018585 [Albula glossodonta]|uniref:Uncharacterized protein n=1 Tax=Albula glossodonta TaxID=121402 RepID=A0A8T2NRY3_9TELE|nr:hypothetical protein JZ751_018585 [Albula glossodonta]
MISFWVLELPVALENFLSALNRWLYEAAWRWNKQSGSRSPEAVFPLTGCEKDSPTFGWILPTHDWYSSTLDKVKRRAKVVPWAALAIHRLRATGCLQPDQWNVPVAVEAQQDVCAHSPLVGLVDDHHAVPLQQGRQVHSALPLDLSAHHTTMQVLHRQTELCTPVRHLESANSVINEKRYPGCGTGGTGLGTRGTLDTLGTLGMGMGTGTRMPTADGLRPRWDALPMGSAGRGFLGGLGFSQSCQKTQKDTCSLLPHTDHT